MNRQINIPSQAEYILNKINHFGYKAYLVGGAVRNSLLDIPVKDWDICTSATPKEICKIFRNEKIIETGLQHGTLTVLVQGIPIEITTFRIDGAYADGRRPTTVEFTDDLTEDLSRRDFTINAIAYNHEEGFIDPFGGIKDLQAGIIRCVGNTRQRFAEDSLRILRAIRFAAQLGFTIEYHTFQEIFEQKQRLLSLSKERIQGEFNNLLVSKDAARILRDFENIIETILPEFHPTVGFNQNNPWHIYPVDRHILETLRQCSTTDLITRLSLFFHDIAKPSCYVVDEKGIGHFPGHGEKGAELTNQILRSLKYDNATREAVVELVKYHDATIEPTKKSVLRWLNRLSEEQFFRLLDIREADIKAQNPKYTEDRLKKVNLLRDLAKQLLEESSCFSLKDLAINGQDLIHLGFTPGKEFGVILETLLNEILDENLLNEKELLLDYVKEHFELPTPCPRIN